MSAIKLFTVTSLLFSAMLFASTNNPFETRAPFKSATIKYSIGGSSQGSSTLYISDYGKYIAEYEKSSMTMFGFSKKEDKLSITTPDWVYTIDMTERTGEKVTNIEKYMQEEYQKLSSSEKKTVQANAKKLGTNATRNIGGDVKFNAAMLHGYSCDKTTVMGMTSYTIHNTAVVLKMEGSVMGMDLKKEALSIDMGSVDKKHFKVPSNVKISYDARADKMMKEQAHQVIEMLLDPDKAPSAMPVARPSESSAPPAPQNNANEAQEAQEAIGKLFKSLF